MSWLEISGVIERRLLVNFLADPKVVEKLLPPKFKPQLIQGQAMVGICLIRLAQMRPQFFPPIFGLSSENAAHRIAVQWESPEGLKTGVYVHRRDTSSLINTILGGRIFSGVQHQAHFDVRESEKEYHVAFKSKDDETEVQVSGEPDLELPKSSIFKNVDQSSEFFKKGSVGFSPGFKSDQYQGLELLTNQWRVQPFKVKYVQSSFFSDPTKFPNGSITFDHALIMRNIPHSWRVAE